MDRNTLKPLKALCLLPLTAFWVASATAQGHTAPTVAPAASMPDKPMEQRNMPQGHMQKGAAGSHDMKGLMTTAMDEMQKMQMSGDIDKDFAMMMKMHHEQALAMAEMELAHGKSADMKTMAKQIVATQKKEIARFDQWLAKQK